MKKIVLFLLILRLCLFFRVCAQNPVSETETKTAAVHYAQSFLQYKNLSSSNILTTDVYKENTVTLMREVVFDNGLSIILSAYKSCLPVLLYSTNHTTILSDIETIPDGLRDFIQNYACVIAYAADANRNLNEHPDWALLLDTGLSENVTRSGHVYGPLLTTIWGQRAAYHGHVYNAYNYYVSTTGCNPPHDTCPAGCVAVAMAQIMKYWNYPVYMPNKVEQYDWCNMPDTLYYIKSVNENNDTNYNYNFIAERNAIARLMADCGSAADMDYCKYPCQSFAWPINARNGLVDTFGYHPDAIRKLRSSYSTQNWKMMLINDISAGRPVLYGGVSWKWNNYELGGHAFVCDGYNENTDKFHFNWGHNGSRNDVWCTIDSIIEGNSNWNHLERAVFNIYPNYTQDYCDFELPLWVHYYEYYNISGNTTPLPYQNVPKTFTRLVSVPDTLNFPASWRTIPNGDTAEYVAHEEIVLQNGFLAEEGSDFYAHIVPCPSCSGISAQSMATGNTLPPMNDTYMPSQQDSSGTSISESQVEQRLQVWPNPVSGTLHIQLPDAEKEMVGISVCDLLGRVMLQKENFSTKTELDVSTLSRGMYIIQVRTLEGKSMTAKFMKE